MASSYLSKGATGDEVRRLQTALNTQGYQLAEDGVYGGKTEAAVRDYQTKSGLKVDGLAGQQTLSKLQGVVAQTPKAPPATPAVGSQVAPVAGAESIQPQVVAAQLAELASKYANPAAQVQPPARAQPTDVSALKQQLNSYMTAAQAQASNSIDYATQQSTNELNRALEDAQPMYKAQRDQIAIDEAQALDKSALYSAVRGDQGGIGEEQYNDIMRTAALNRRAVATEQTKLATDTARQVADMRARGEYEKADAMLEMTQNYLSQLISLEQWAAEYNMSVDEFNTQLAQWQKEYETAVTQWGVQMTGKMPDGTPTYAAQQDLQNRQASIASAMLEAGIMPSPEQLTALGMDADQAQQLLTANRLANAAKGPGGPGRQPAEVVDDVGVSQADLKWAQDVVKSWEAGETDRYSSKEYREALGVIDAAKGPVEETVLSSAAQGLIDTLDNGKEDRRGNRQAYSDSEKIAWLATAAENKKINDDDFINAMNYYGFDPTPFLAE